ncbi:MAG: thermonuclease family protein [Lautropia sp.]
MPAAPSPEYRGRIPFAASVAAAAFALAILLVGCGPTTPVVRAPAKPAAAEGSAEPAPLRARLARIQDGDSFIAIGDDGRRRTIRISGIDAPERGQPFADRSRDHLRRLLAERTLAIQPVKIDQYRRVVAKVLVIDGEQAGDAGLTQIQAGLAWYFRRYASDLPAADRDRYAAAERTARAAGRGLWAQPRPEAPWLLRQREH